MMDRFWKQISKLEEKGTIKKISDLFAPLKTRTLGWE